MAFAPAHAAICLALAVLLWAVQLIIYPAFRSIDPARFQRWHYAYTGQITLLVAPLILLQTGGTLLRRVFLAESSPLWITECALTALAWLVTGCLSVPLHRQLQQGRDERAIERLIHTNWLRTLAWSGTALCSWIAAG
jgi:hypothetical protein